ncbi:MAG: alpha-mannosidase [Micrococcales bacterium 73-15]|uniref:alpha-mannosidase n=1 Tax=Salana multivorans TaxID=120377 RepID=UPI0009639FA0|nr:glycoside hydrolase family 38 C-terminal domain-containing protein [Salana multivorans]OJX97470.1 MAG: alpha-mannosidase [Micrococcales bacterium 73-15]
MHDDIELTRGRVRRVLTERIVPAIHGARAEVELAWHELDGEPVPPADGLALDYTPTEVGTPWGPAWGTTWFRVTGTVPREWAGRRVELLADLGFDVNMTGFQAEALVYRPDGTPVKSLNPRNQYVTVARQAEGGERVELYLEAASNPVLLDYHPFLPTREGDVRTSSPRQLYRTRTIELGVFEPEVFELAMDLDVLLELQAELPQGPRRARIQQGLDDALDVLDLQDVAGTAARSRAVLAPVLAASAGESEHRISAVGHAHIDSAWLWPVRETIRKVARTSSSMAELIDETDDFVFGMSSAQQYAWLKEHRPEVYARVKDAVAAGRFLPLGGMWVESDTVMPSGEALVRQLVYGQQFFETEFGMRCKGVWLPDSFGYSPALPQLIVRAGFDWFFTQKISWNQVNVFPHHTFLWEGIDGSRVFTHFPPMDTYNSQLSGMEVAKASRQFRESRVATGSIAPVGWGDGGGGTTREMVGRAARLRDLEGSARVAWEHPDAFYERAMAELSEPPVWVGELYLELHRATLTSQHRTKQGNRRCEWLLAEAELWSTQAALEVDHAFPHDELEALWRQVLLQQFHDILPGTSIAWVHREAVAEYERIEAAATELIERALAALVGAGDREIAVNPAAFDRGAVPAGGALPREEVAAASGDVAPVTLVDDGDGGFVLANGLVEVRVSAQGTVTSARDLATGHDVIAPGAEGNLFQLHQDFPNMWDAWDVDRHYRNMMTVLRKDATLTGELVDGRAVLTLTRPFSASSLTQAIVLEPGSRTVLFETEVDWHETEKFLKVAFPLDVRAAETLAETQYGYQRRVTHTNTSWEAAKFEASMHRYVLAAEESAPGEAIGAALVNDSLYGHDVTRDASGADVTTTMRLSLLRAPRFPDPETDQGVQTMTYGLVVGADVAAATSAGALLSSPERVVRGEHGIRPLVVTTGDGVVLSNVTLAHDRSGDVVVRVYEAYGRRARGTLTVRGEFASVDEVSLLEDSLGGVDGADLSGGHASIDLTLRPFEVRTLRLARA